MAKQKYSKEGAKRFAYSVQETYEFAQLAQLKSRDILQKPDESAEGASITPLPQNVKFPPSQLQKNEPPTSVIPTAPTDLEPNEVSLSLGDSYIYIRVPKDISEEDAKKLKQMITAMTLGLIGKSNE